MSLRATITDTFTISGRGVVVTLDRSLPPTTPQTVIVTIEKPDGSLVETEGYLEIVRRTVLPRHETSAILLTKVTKDEIRVGAQVVISSRKAHG